MDLNGMTAAMYLRKSRPVDGVPPEEILRRQEATLDEFAERNGIRIVGRYREIKSGEHIYNRPEMVKLLEAVEAKRFQAVLCVSFDRLTRGDDFERGSILRTFKSSGALIVTPNETYDLSDSNSAFLTAIKGLIANYELNIGKERTRRGMIRAAKEGKHLSYPPYGYRKRYVDGKRSVMEIYEPEAAFVRMAFDLYASGVGCDLIAQRLTEAGARPRRAAMFFRGTVLKMIKNPVYTGKIVYNREQWTKRDGKLEVKIRPESEWVISDGLHAPIVDADTFNRCQEILKNRWRRPYFDGKIKNPLTGLIRCRKCGGLMQCIRSDSVYRLHCLKRGCVKSTHYDLVESRVIAALRETLSALEMEPDAPSEAAKASAEARLAEIGKAIDAGIRKKNKIYEYLEAEVYSVTEYHERMEAVNATLSALERQRTEAQAEIERLSRADGRRQAAEIRNVLDMYWDADGAGRNILLKSVVDVVWYAKDSGSGPQDFDLEIFLR